jgi:predicted outer membrane protein
MAALLAIGVASAGWTQTGNEKASTESALVKTVAPGIPGVPNEATATKYGPLSPADKDFLVRVRYAGLWEKPAGLMGQQRSSDPLIKEASKHLIDGHTDLDAKVIAIGNELGVDMPTKPTKLTQEMLDEMKTAGTPDEFGYFFANRLRLAHGKVYSLLGRIRAGTKNAMSRKFAEYCMATVLDHMTVLEATGRVDWDEIETPEFGGVSTETYKSTQYGPLSAADEQFLATIREAGLWAKKAGTQAAKRSKNPQVKAAAQRVAKGHADLDAKSIAIGQMFNVKMPTRATADQQGWLNEMAAAESPEDYDTVFATRVRAAHGASLAVLTDIRAGTKNAMIRTFANYAIKDVLAQMNALEKTQQVNFQQVPDAPAPEFSVGLGDRDVNWIIVLVMLLAVGGISVVVLRELYGRRG